MGELSQIALSSLNTPTAARLSISGSAEPQQVPRSSSTQPQSGLDLVHLLPQLLIGAQTSKQARNAWAELLQAIYFSLSTRHPEQYTDRQGRSDLSIVLSDIKTLLDVVLASCEPGSVPPARTLEAALQLLYFTDSIGVQLSSSEMQQLQQRFSKARFEAAYKKAEDEFWQLKSTSKITLEPGLDARSAQGVSQHTMDGYLPVLEHYCSIARDLQAQHETSLDHDHDPKSGRDGSEAPLFQSVQSDEAYLQDAEPGSQLQQMLEFLLPHRSTLPAHRWVDLITGAPEDEQRWHLLHIMQSMQHPQCAPTDVLRTVLHRVLDLQGGAPLFWQLAIASCLQSAAAATAPTQQLLLGNVRDARISGSTAHTLLKQTLRYGLLRMETPQVQHMVCGEAYAHFWPHPMFLEHVDF